jgi:hypothetical protein
LEPRIDVDVDVDVDARTTARDAHESVVDVVVIRFSARGVSR